MLCLTLAVGIHIATSHSANTRQDLNEFNPGMYVRCNSYVVGAYYNSFSNLSVYGAKMVPIADKLSLVVGGVSGYSRPMPLMMLSYQTTDGLRVNFIPNTPRALGGLHITKEF